jgi:hypothetical protein
VCMCLCMDGWSCAGMGGWMGLRGLQALTHMRQALRFRTADYMGGVARVHERALASRATHVTLAATALGRRTLTALPPLPADEAVHVTLADGATLPRLIRGADRGHLECACMRRALTDPLAWRAVYMCLCVCVCACVCVCRLPQDESRPCLRQGWRGGRQRSRRLYSLHGRRDDGCRLCRH